MARGDLLCGVAGASAFASKEQRGERQRNYSARCAVSSQALVKDPMHSTLSGGIRTHGPERAHPVDQPLARRATSQLDDHVVGERCGRSVAPNGDSLGRGAEEVRSPLPRLRPAGRNRQPRFAPLRPLAEGSAHVVGAGLRACGEVPRPLVGGLGDRPPRPRQRDGEAHGRDDADGRAVEPAPARDVAREAVAQARLAGRPDAGRPWTGSADHPAARRCWCGRSR